MNKVGISCLTGGELTEYHDDAQHPEPWMPTARRAEIAEHLAECDHCTAELAEIAKVTAFVRRALTQGDVSGGQVSGEFVRDLKRMAEEMVK